MDIANQQNKKQSLDFLAWAYGFIDARAETLGH